MVCRARMRSRKPGAKRSICASMRSVISQVAIGDVTVGPHRLLARRRSRRVEEALLRDQHEGLFRYFPLPDLPLGAGNFRKCTAQVHRCGAQAFFSLPGNGAIEREIEFEDAAAIAKAPQVALIALRQLAASDPQQLTRRNIAQYAARGWQIID